LWRIEELDRSDSEKRLTAEIAEIAERRQRENRGPWSKLRRQSTQRGRMIKKI
jgi:hypothetical protein